MPVELNNPDGANLESLLKVTPGTSTKTSGWTYIIKIIGTGAGIGTLDNREVPGYSIGTGTRSTGGRRGAAPLLSYHSRKLDRLNLLDADRCVGSALRNDAWRKRGQRGVCRRSKRARLDAFQERRIATDQRFLLHTGPALELCLALLGSRPGFCALRSTPRGRVGGLPCTSRRGRHCVFARALRRQLSNQCRGYRLRSGGGRRSRECRQVACCPSTCFLTLIVACHERTPRRSRG